jgi:hypothetical protein
VPRFVGNGSSHGLLGDGLVVVKVVVLNSTFQSDKTAVAAHFSKALLYFQEKKMGPLNVQRPELLVIG